MSCVLEGIYTDEICNEKYEANIRAIYNLLGVRVHPIMVNIVSMLVHVLCTMWRISNY